jgi:tetrahydromethanopterin S-methyltransferase subunit A
MTLYAVLCGSESNGFRTAETFTANYGTWMSDRAGAVQWLKYR